VGNPASVSTFLTSLGAIVCKRFAATSFGPFVCKRAEASEASICRASHDGSAATAKDRKKNKASVSRFWEKRVASWKGCRAH